VLNLGDEVDVRVDDIDPQGKVSLSLAGDEPVGGEEPSGNGAERAERAERAPRAVSAPSNGGDSDGGGDVVSFEDFFEDEARKEFGDLGPADTGSRAGGGGRGEGGRGGEGGPRRNPRRGGRR